MTDKATMIAIVMSEAAAAAAGTTSTEQIAKEEIDQELNQLDQSNLSTMRISGGWSKTNKRNRRSADRRIENRAKRAVQLERCGPASLRQNEAGSAIGALRAGVSKTRRSGQCNRSAAGRRFEDSAKQAVQSECCGPASRKTVRSGHCIWSAAGRRVEDSAKRVVQSERCGLASRR